MCYIFKSNIVCFIYDKVVMSFKNIEVASMFEWAYIEPLSSEMYVSVCVVRRVHVVDRPANSGAGHSRPCCWL